MKVLTIDNDAALQAALVRLIRTWGGQADSADTALGGIEMLRQYHYDIIMLGIRLPTASGLWFLSNAPIPPDTKVVAMATCAPRSTVQHLKTLGVCAFLQKPFDTEELLFSLEECMRKEPATRAAPGRPCPAHAA